MRNYLVILALLVFNGVILTQSAVVNNDTTSLGLLTVGGGGVHTFFVESFLSKPLILIKKDNKTTFGLTQSNNLLTLSNDVSQDQLFIRNPSLSPSYINIGTDQPSLPSFWNIKALTFPSVPHIANFTIGHSENASVINIQGDGKVGIGLNPNYNSTVNVDGNIRLSGALRPNGNAGEVGQILKFVNNAVSPIWVSNTNADFDNYKIISINKPYTVNNGNSIVIENLPVNITANKTLVEFNFSTVIKGNACFLCGKANGYITVSLVPVGGYPPMYLLGSHHVMHYWFEVDADKLNTVNGVGFFEFDVSIPTGPYNLSITVFGTNGTFLMGSGNLPTTSTSDYFFNYKISTP